MSYPLLDLIAERNRDPFALINSDLRQRPVRMVYLNPATYLHFRTKAHRLDYATHIRFDGLYISKMMRLAKVHSWPRCSFDFSSLAKDFFESAQRREYRLFLLGGSEEANENFARLIALDYPGTVIIGRKNGYFEDEAEVIETILAARPDVVIVSLGGRKQEEFGANLAAAGYAGSIVSCGAFFEQTRKMRVYYPNWAVDYELRWFYRLFRERGILQRVLVEYPLFTMIFLYDILARGRGTTQA